MMSDREIFRALLRHDIPTPDCAHALLLFFVFFLCHKQKSALNIPNVRHDALTKSVIFFWSAPDKILEIALSAGKIHWFYRNINVYFDEGGTVHSISELTRVNRLNTLLKEMATN